MSRLLELLEEQKNLKQLDEREMVAKITGNMYRKYTDVGNLFRLMLVTNENEEFPVVGKMDLVSKMLPDLIQDEEKKVKALQTQFNKMKKIYKEGKKPTVAMKKVYFSLLFGLLIPVTGSSALKPTTLTNNFASNSATAQAFQRKTSILIGRALLSSDQTELNTKDKAAIKGYIIGAEELDSVEDEQTLYDDPEVVQPETDLAKEETQPVTKVETVVNHNTTDEELDSIIAKTEQANTVIKEDLENHEARASAIKTTLKENKSPETFHVSGEGIDPETIKIINDKLTNVYNDVTKSMGVENANFVTKFVKDAIDNLNSVKGFINFNAESLRFNVRPGKDSFVITMAAGDPRNGSEELFFMDRSFFKGANGNLIVKNDQLQIPGSLQGTSINKDIFRDALDLYKAKGVEKVQLEANVDVGGYAWFRYGFTPEDNTQIKLISAWMKDVLPMVYSALQYDAYDVGEYILKKSHDKSQDLKNLSELLKQGQTDTAKAVIDKLAVNCAKEFQAVYSSKEAYKTMQKDLALKNFKSITHKGTKYTISYKALLSIQALKDDTDFAIVPMTNGVYLNWLGELDMNNLEDTYMYLNQKKA